MKLPRPRFTVRRLMVAVAIVAFLAFVAGLAIEGKRRADEYGREADRIGAELMRLGQYKQDLPSVQARQARLGKLFLKYSRAARYPWLPVAPDPPEPE